MRFRIKKPWQIFFYLNLWKPYLVFSFNEGHGPFNFTIDSGEYFYFYLHPIKFGYERKKMVRDLDEKTMKPISDWYLDGAGWWAKLNRCRYCDKIWGLRKWGCKNCMEQKQVWTKVQGNYIGEDIP